MTGWGRVGSFRSVNQNGCCRSVCGQAGPWHSALLLYRAPYRVGGAPHWVQRVSGPVREARGRGSADSQVVAWREQEPHWVGSGHPGPLREGPSGPKRPISLCGPHSLTCGPVGSASVSPQSSRSHSRCALAALGVSGGWDSWPRTCSLQPLTWVSDGTEHPVPGVFCRRKDPVTCLPSRWPLR